MRRFDPSSVEVARPVVHVAWGPDDCLAYALGLGIGLHDSRGLEFVTEGTAGRSQRTVVGFATTLLLTGARGVRLGVERGRIVHAGQSLELHRELAPSGVGEVRVSVLGVHDLGRHALVRIAAQLLDPGSGASWARGELEMLLVGCGGFGGARPPEGGWSVPDREPDVVTEFPTLPGQPLLYRMSGDRNPLHSDPEVARASGFDGPILHGLFTFGATGHVLEQAMLAGDRRRFGSMAARFGSVAYPGVPLAIRGWLQPERIVFQTMSGGEVVLDGGVLALRPPSDGR